MRRNGHHIEADVDAAMASHEAKGQTAVLVAIDGDVTQTPAARRELPPPLKACFLCRNALRHVSHRRHSEGGVSAGGADAQQHGHPSGDDHGRQPTHSQSHRSAGTSLLT